jgi:hypothetical protein
VTGSRAAGVEREPVEPAGPGLVEHFEEDRLAAVEVAQHVGLREPHPVGDVAQRDVRDLPLAQHLRRRAQDRRTPGRHLLGPPRPLERGHPTVSITHP